MTVHILEGVAWANEYVFACGRSVQGSGRAKYVTASRRNEATCKDCLQKDAAEHKSNQENGSNG